MADLVNETDAIYALAREYLVKSATLDSSIKLTELCKPHLEELKKVCPWPFGKSYKYPCEHVIRVAGIIADRAFSRIDNLISSNRYSWSYVRQDYQKIVNSTLNPIKIQKLGDVISSYYLSDDSKRILSDIIIYLSCKQEELRKLDDDLRELD